MIVVHTSIPIEPNRRAEAVEAAETLAERSREEDGTVTYRAMTDVENPNVLRFFEGYEDVAALEAHVKTDYYHAFSDRLPALVDGEIETMQFRVEESETVHFDVEELQVEPESN